MMSIRGLCVCVCLCAIGVSSSAAQPLRVPDRMKLGALHLKINRHARKKIEERVHALMRNPAGIREKVARAHLYFPIITRVLAEEKVPDAFKYLAIQESALVARAVSSSNAVGFWQFKYPAANEVGLEMNEYVDERMHIEASTRGACRYLKQHYVYFKNWIYAMTAYYTGRTGAERYVEEKYIGRGSMAINKKTHWYVIHFLSHYLVYSHAIQDETPRPDLHLRAHEVTNGGSLASIAEQIAHPLNSLRAHNAWLLSEQIPSHKTYTVYAPSAGMAPTVKDNRWQHANTLSASTKLLALLQRMWRRVKTQEHYHVRINRLPALVAQKNDTLDSLIHKSGLTRRRFLRYNDISKTHKVVQGNIYYLRKKRAFARAGYHIVQPNEHTWDIAQLYGVRLRSLMRKNYLDSMERPTPYTKLWLSRTRPAYDPDDLIPPPSPVLPYEANGQSSHPHRERSASARPRAGWHRHKVRRLENLHLIAKKYGVSVQEIAAWNNIENVGNIQEGMTLYLDVQRPVEDPLPPMEKDRKDTAYTTHRVRKGDTLYAIARRYQTSVQRIKALNKKDSDKLRVGEKLLLPRPNKTSDR